MKMNSWTSLRPSRWGMSAVIIGFCAFVPTSRGDVTVINNLAAPLGSDSTAASFSGPSGPIAQVFTMDNNGGNISGLTLQLNAFFTGSATIDLYSATSGGAPFGSATAIGTVTAGSTGDQQLAVALNAGTFTLTAGQTYAIAMEIPSGGAGTIAWDGTAATGSGGTAPSPLGGMYTFSGGTWNATTASGTDFLQMQLTAVPEVSMTGVLMGFGALTIAVGHTLRRKVRPVVS